jgi:hypothetical protein
MGVATPTCGNPQYLHSVACDLMLFDINLQKDGTQTGARPD